MKSSQRMLNPLSAFLEMKWVRLVICVVLVGLWGSACVPKPCLTWGKKSKTITYMQPIERPMYVEKMKCLERGKAGDRGVQHPDWQPKSTEQCQTTYLRTTLLDEGVYGTSERNECGDYGLCTYVGKRCRPTETTHCAESETCADRGNCHLIDERCLPASDADCAGTSDCSRSGHCAYVARGPGYLRLPECMALAPEHCEPSYECEAYDRCVPYRGKCLNAGEAAEKTSRDVKRQKEFEERERRKRLAFEKEANEPAPVYMLEMNQEDCDKAKEDVGFSSCRIAGEWLLPEFASPKSSLMTKDRELGEAYLIRSCMDYPDEESWLSYGVDNCRALIGYLEAREDPRVDAARAKLARLEVLFKNP